MTTDEVIEAILLTVSKHRGDKLDLYDRLSDLGVEWVEKHNELMHECDDDEDDPDSTIEYEEDK